MTYRKSDRAELTASPDIPSTGQRLFGRSMRLLGGHERRNPYPVTPFSRATASPSTVQASPPAPRHAPTPHPRAPRANTASTDVPPSAPAPAACRADTARPAPATSGLISSPNRRTSRERRGTIRESESAHIPSCCPAEASPCPVRFSRKSLPQAMFRLPSISETPAPGFAGN